MRDLISQTITYVCLFIRTAHTELIALSVATAVTLMDVALPLGIAAVWLVGQVSDSS